MRKKKPTKCDKSIVKCGVGIAECDNRTVKCEEKKGTAKCDKRTVTYDVGIAQYEDGTVKCEKKKPLNVTKVLSTVMLQLHNVKIEPSNVTKR